jgi:polar amino acid transport system permease protein
MFIFWFFFLVPILIGRPISSFTAGLLAMTLFNTSYMAEVIRAGIQSVPKTQMEAARSTGLSYLQSMWRVILPQAFFNILPAAISRLIALLMASSLVFTIGVTEFFRAAQNVNSREFAPYTIYCFVAIMYFVMCFSLSLLGQYAHKRLAPHERISKSLTTSA